MRVVVVAVTVAFFQLLVACNASLSGVARAQFARDYRCDDTEIGVEQSDGHIRVNGCGRQTDYVCAEQRSPLSLDDQAMCVGVGEHGAPWRPGALAAAR